MYMNARGNILNAWGSAGFRSAVLVLFAVWPGLAAAGETPGTAPARARWPMFRGDSAQTGVARSPLPEKLELLWTHEAKSAVESTAAIVDNTVYVGNEGGALLALDLMSGRPKWTYKAGDAIRAAPAVRGGRVFVGDGSGVFHAVNARTGAKLWTFKTDDEIISSANCTGRDVLVGSYDGFLYCLRAQTGKLKWKFETDAQVHCSPCVAEGDAVIAGCDGMVRMIDVATGKESAKVEIGANVAASPAFDGDLIYLATYSGHMMCVDPVGRRIAWDVAQADEAPFYASAAVSGESVVFAGRDRVVRCLRTADGKEQWRFRARSKVDSSPVIVPGGQRERVFFGSDDGRLYAVRLKDGVKCWSFAAGSPITASPAVGEGRLVIGTGDGAIYCFGARQQPGPGLQAVERAGRVCDWLFGVVSRP